MRFLFLFTVTACTAATGCINMDIYNQVNKQTVLIDTPMTSGASCSLTDRSGRTEYTGDTPSAVTVSVGRAPLTVLCWKDGYKKATAHIDEEYIPIENFPVILEELTGFIKDPFKQPGARYPENITMWLEPIRWPSSSYEAKWRKAEKTHAKEQEEMRLARKRKMESLRELEMLLKYRKENESIRDPRFDDGFFDYLKLRVRRLGGGSMIPELVREDSDLDYSLNNLTAEELAEEYLEFKRQRYLHEIGSPQSE